MDKTLTYPVERSPSFNTHCIINCHSHWFISFILNVSKFGYHFCGTCTVRKYKVCYTYTVRRFIICYTKLIVTGKILSGILYSIFIYLSRYELKVVRLFRNVYPQLLWISKKVFLCNIITLVYTFLINNLFLLFMGMMCMRERDKIDISVIEV